MLSQSAREQSQRADDGGEGWLGLLQVLGGGDLEDGHS